MALKDEICGQLLTSGRVTVDDIGEMKLVAEALQPFEHATLLLESDRANGFHLIAVTVKLMKWAKTAGAQFGSVASKLLTTRWVEMWSSDVVHLCMALLPLKTEDIGADLVFQLTEVVRLRAPALLHRVHKDLSETEWRERVVKDYAWFRTRRIDTTSFHFYSDVEELWTTNSATTYFETLRILFEVLRCIPMSEVSCERAFSAHEDVFHCRRSMMSMKRLEAQLFLACNHNRQVNRRDAKGGPALPLDFNPESLAVINEMLNDSLKPPETDIPVGSAINFGEYHEAEKQTIYFNATVLQKVGPHSWRVRLPDGKTKTFCPLTLHRDWRFG